MRCRARVSFDYRSDFQLPDVLASPLQVNMSGAMGKVPQLQKAISSAPGYVHMKLGR